MVVDDRKQSSVGRTEADIACRKLDEGHIRTDRNEDAAEACALGSVAMLQGDLGSMVGDRTVADCSLGSSSVPG